MTNKITELITGVVKWGIEMARKNFSDERATDYDINKNYQSNEVAQIYLGSAFDMDVSTPTPASTQGPILTIGSEQIGNADYIEIDLNATCSAEMQLPGSGALDPMYPRARLNYSTRIKGTGGYVDSMSSRTVYSMRGISGTQGNTYLQNEGAISKRWLHTLTDGQKASGIDIQITSQGLTTSGTGVNYQRITMTNDQTVLYTKF